MWSLDQRHHLGSYQTGKFSCPTSDMQKPAICALTSTPGDSDAWKILWATVKFESHCLKVLESMQRAFLGYPAFISCKVSIVWDLGQKAESGNPIIWVESGSFRTISTMAGQGLTVQVTGRMGDLSWTVAWKVRTLSASGRSCTTGEPWLVFTIL